MHFSLSCLSLGLMVLSGLVSAAPQMHTSRQKRFNHFHNFAKYVAASGVTGDCPNPPNGAQILKQINQASTDTQATIFIDHKRKQIIFASPGSATAADYTRDADTTQIPYSGCSGCQVHQGFWGAWSSIKDETRSTISSALASNQGYHVIVTGYSLGAAIAALAWTDLRTNGLHVDRLYGFGQPRVGNPAFAAYVDRLSGAGDKNTGGYFRIIHNRDPVPNWPAQWDGYQSWRHPMTQYWEHAETGVTPQNTWRCYGQESPDCSLSVQDFPDGNDHLTYANVYFPDGGKYCYGS